MNKNIHFSLLVFLINIFFCFPGNSQFYTIRPKDRINTDSTITKGKEIESLDTSQQTGIEEGIEEKKYSILSGMKKRMYLSLPIDELKINSTYGYRRDPFTGKRKFHKGVDFDADFNYVYSIMPGKVIKSGRSRSYGEFVQIKHGEFITTYAHLFQRLVDKKDAVEAGQPIGISGSTGRSTGEHLHFEVIFQGKNVDPTPILNYINNVVQQSRQELNSLSIPKQ